MPFERLTKTIDERTDAKISMTKTVTINPEPLLQLLNKKYAYDENVAQVITFLDALLSDQPRKTFNSVFGTSHYFQSSNDSPQAREANTFNLSRTVQLLRGIFQSARPGPGYMTINVDVAHTAFYTPDITIIDLLVDNLKLSGTGALAPINPNLQRAVVKLLKGLGVYTTHTTRRDQGSRQEKYFFAQRDRKISH